VPGTAEWDAYEVEHRQRYEFVAEQCRGLRVLDVACGVGYGSQILAERGAASVVGVDISQEAVDIARTRFAHPNVEYRVGDARKLEFLRQRFDVAISFETIEHLADPKALIEAVHGVLNPGGLFACSTPNPDFHNKSCENPYHLCELNYADFESAFAKYFNVDGRFHQSPSPSYVRHLALLSEIEAAHTRMRFSLAFRLEEKLRELLGKPFPRKRPTADVLQRIVHGDYVIEPIQRPSEKHGVFILRGMARAAVAPNVREVEPSVACV
jgi:SAM-dependent methyltransferase